MSQNLKLDFTKKLEFIQQEVLISISGAWRGNNTDKLHKEFDWEIFYYMGW